MKKADCYECGEPLKMTCDECGTRNCFWVKRVQSFTIDGMSVYGLGALTFLTGLAVGAVWS